jgi:peptide/nickel transport system permease protein
VSLAQAIAAPGPAVDERTRSADYLGLVALGLLTLLTIGLAVAPALLGAGERDIVGGTFVGPGRDHLFGTDSQGRDMFARTILGARTSWFAAIAVVAVGAAIGSIVGLIAGFSGGFIDAILMRVTDAALALPGPLVALAVVSGLGTGLRNTLIAVAATWWPWYARLVRGQVHALTRMPFVEAARLGGVGRIRRAFVHMLPGTVGPVIVAISLDLGAVILVLAGLSFLGLGSPPPAAELGAMSSQGLTFLFNAWWISIVPAAALFVLATLANFAGDALRDLAER